MLYSCSQQWLLDRQDIVRERQADLKVLNEDEYQKLMIFFAGCEYLARCTNYMYFCTPFIVTLLIFKMNNSVIT